jgi:hypothetical protein
MLFRPFVARQRLGIASISFQPACNASGWELKAAKYHQTREPFVWPAV